MIVEVTGKVCEINNNCLSLEVNGFCYEVLVPTTILQRISSLLPEDKTIRLITYHYHQIEPSRSIPVLIGFLNKLEKDFFEQFISVSGIGPRAAIKAINQPISTIAQAIANADMQFLTTLPGIGRQRAKDIIAKLQDKVGRFGLLQDNVEPIIKAKQDLEEQALQILEKLQYKKQEAKDMIKKALLRCADVNSVEELLNEVYRQRQAK
jgi:Holliday junction DNA helicase RuvA